MSWINALRLKTDFKYFCQFVWEDPITGSKLKITKQHLDLVKTLMKWTKALVVAYRWFGKSTISTFLYPLWRATQHRQSVLIFSATEELAVDKLRLIKTALETNPNLQRWNGKWYTTWNDKEIWLVDREKKFIDATWKEQYPIVARIKAMWFNSSFRWVHPDIIIADDIVTEENTFLSDKVTPDEDKIRAVKKVFKGKVVPLRNPGGSVILVGTPLYWDKNNIQWSDLLFEWYNKKDVNKFYLPALTEDWNPSCPELHSYEFLMEQKEMQDEMTWLREYMLQPITTSSWYLSEEMLAWCKDMNYTYQNSYQPSKDEVVLVWTDYAIIDDKKEAERKKTAYFALVAVAYNKKTQERKIINIFYDRWLWFTEQLELTVAWLRKYNAAWVCLETHWWMRYFMWELRKIIPSHIRIINASNKKSKFDFFQWLPSLQYLFEKRLIKLAAMTLEDNKKSDFLIYEMLLLDNAKHVDVIDALLRVDLAIRKYYWSVVYRKLNYDKYLSKTKDSKEEDIWNEIVWKKVEKDKPLRKEDQKKETVDLLMHDYNIDIIGHYV